MRQDATADRQRIGLALSGGGSRAIAFHLGCLRALEEMGVLQRVDVISTVSGGSVIGALYAAHDGSFGSFEEKVRKLLKLGLVRPAIAKALTTTEGVRAVACWSFLTVTAAAHSLLWVPFRFVLGLTAGLGGGRHRTRDGIEYPPTRFASRTTILRRTLDDDVFQGKRLAQLPRHGPQLIINAADLRTGSAFYFSSSHSGSWRLGTLVRSDISLAHAVTASAAYPLLLPALDEWMRFQRKDGAQVTERVILTDGGVYDNLALAPLWPDRDPSISLNAPGVNSVICCRAGYGLRVDPPSQSMVSRLTSAFACTHDRAQNATMKRLFDLQQSGALRRLLLPFLGQDDGRLTHAPDDLVSREGALDYATDFFAMPEEWIETLSMRGYQITYALARQHWPELLSGASGQA